MVYKWESYGNESNPVIALLAPSDALSQEIIEGRKDRLVRMGFCVKMPKFDETEGLLVEPNIFRKKSRIDGGVSPAVSKEVGANQIIESINKGWNIVALMGGESFKDKIPLILDHFEHNTRNDSIPRVKIFGMSDTTYANILASHGICDFVSTPFTNIFYRSETDDVLKNQADNLEKALKKTPANHQPFL